MLIKATYSLSYCPRFLLGFCYFDHSHSSAKCSLTYIWICIYTKVNVFTVHNCQVSMLSFLKKNNNKENMAKTARLLNWEVIQQFDVACMFCNNSDYTLGWHDAHAYDIILRISRETYSACREIQCKHHMFFIHL